MTNLCGNGILKQYIRPYDVEKNLAFFHEACVCVQEREMEPGAGFNMTCARAMRTRNAHAQCASKPNVKIDMYVQYANPICTPNVHAQCAHQIRTCVAHAQSAPAMRTPNAHPQWVCLLRVGCF